MLRDITIGQYFPKDSIIHRLDARIKLILTFVYMVIIFIAKSFWGYGALGVFLLITIMLSKVPLKFFFRGLRPLLFFVILTGLINLFLTPGEVIWNYGIFTITREGVYYAVFLFFRIVLLISGGSLLTYTTSPIMLTGAMESLMKPLSKIKFPSHEIAMMMTIALRMIPTLLEETDKIMKAQSARCADFESGGLIKRAKAMIPLLVPLFISAFRRADELAVAMESRCYTGGEGRTRFRRPKITYIDYVAVSLVAALGVGIFWIKI